MPFGSSGCSITAEASGWFDRLKLGEIEIDNCPQGLRERTVLLIVRQPVQPCAILGLEIHRRGDGVVSALDSAATVGGATEPNDRHAIAMRGAVACLPFGPGHGGFTDRFAGHGFHSKSLRDGIPVTPQRLRRTGAPVHVTPRHQRPCHAGHFVGERYGGDLAWLARE